jgi:cytochrome c-type biogenesis protein CcmH/NrfG
MKNIKQVVWKLIGGVTLLAVTFVTGYILGSKNQQGHVQTEKTLSSSDIEHAFGNMGNVKQSSHISTEQEATVQSLSGLVAGLEKKVAANPENIDQQLLLAQTYKELGERSKSLKLLQALNKQSPKNAQVKITLATVLMTETDKQELKEALQVFDDAIKLKPDAAGMARLYQGEVRVKLEKMGN